MKKIIFIIIFIIGIIFIGNVIIENFDLNDEIIEPSVHEHLYVDGYCQCGEKDPNYKENITNNDQTIDIEELLPSIDLQEVSDTETIVHSLIYSSLSAEYDTFLGVISLDGNDLDEGPTDVLGITYVDYSDAYQDEDGKTYFSSGFISLAGENPISRSNIQKGLEIHSLEEEELDDFSYIYGFYTDDLHTHCIINNKYIIYDIIDGCIIYEEQDYVEGMDVDHTRGNIYNYDTEEYVYIVDEIDYVPVRGVSVIGEADYEMLFAEVNNILLNQETNLSYAEVESYVKNSKEAFISYLLTLQEEKFMGIPTDELIAMARNIDPMEHIRLTVDETGITKYDIIHVTKIASLEEKIVVGSVCGVGIVLGVACNIIGKIYGPANLVLGPLGGMLTGVCMDVMMQVVISTTPVSDIQWSSVAVSAASGAISGLISCGLDKMFSSSAFKGIEATTKFLLKEVVDTACDGIIGGSEAFANSLIGGETFSDACKKFGDGVIMGAIISAGFKVITNGAAAGIKSFISKTNLDEKIVKIGQKTLTKVADTLEKFGMSEKAVLAVKKMAEEFTLESIQVKKLTKKILNQLPSDKNTNLQIVDEFGNVIKKQDFNINMKAYITLKDTASQEIRDLFVDKSGKAISRIPIINGIPNFDLLALGKVSTSGIKSIRSSTFKELDALLADDWSKNEYKIPEHIKEYFKNNGVELDNIRSTDISKLRAAFGLTWHEAEDCLSGLLVPTDIHKRISHYGGYALSKVQKIWECLSMWGKYVY